MSGIKMHKNGAKDDEENPFAKRSKGIYRPRLSERDVFSPIYTMWIKNPEAGAGWSSSQNHFNPQMFRTSWKRMHMC